MRDGAAERRGSGALPVDVDPLEVVDRLGEGVDALKGELLRIVGWADQGENVILARERHLVALREAREHVEFASQRLNELELMAEELRLAQEAVNRITGEFGADDLLGVIFSRFCIGK